MADILDGSDSDCEELKINKKFADNYDRWRGKEELQKFTDRYGEDALGNLDDSDDGSSTSTEEDEDAKEITPQVEKQFFKALSCLKKKDPKIYETSTRFFEKNSETEAATSLEKEKGKKKKKEKSMFLRDYERKILLERGGQLSSDEEDETARNRSSSPTFVQEQKEIQQSFKKVLKDSSDDDEKQDGIGGLFRPRQKTKEQKIKEEEDYREWLIGKKEELKDSKDASELGYLKSYWSDPKLEEGEVFLRDYIINRRYLEGEDDDYVPSYEEVLHEDEDLSEDEKNVEQMEQFEHKYNFRFEEPDQDFVKRYPRTMTGSLRQQDDRRKVHREELKERKEREKEAKRQELKQLKAIKRKEIAERLEKLKEITGNADITFEQEDLNEDFDPEKHDQRMEKLFAEEFYDAESDDKKPEFPDLDEELELENWDQYETAEPGKGSADHEPHCEDPDFNMDCDYDPRAALHKEMVAAQQPRGRKNRKRSRLAEALSKKKPRFDRKEQQLDKYMDEYYGLDYEDIIGDLPCRFKYRNVVGNNYGLTIEEILIADDKELNRWCSLKKTCQYRPEATEMYDVQAYKAKGNLEDLKRKILPSLFKHDEADDEKQDTEEDKNEEKKKKKKKKKKKSQIKNDISALNGETKLQSMKQEKEDNEDGDNSSKTDSLNNSKKERKATKRKAIKEEIDEITEENSVVSPAKKNKKKQAEPESGQVMQKTKKQDISVGEKSEVHASPSASKKKKNKKQKQKSGIQGISLKPKQQDICTPNGNSSAVTKHNKHKQNTKRQNTFDKGSNKPDETPQISDSRLKAYGINPKKFKNKIKYGKK